ncbi:MAG: Lrp/AsnC family transcriptional regulator [Alphaproteobacteria bacterium]|nr:MAG: Lrp/AsnC family transcriptional regulator [Alphaproteobacteria bacterium]
MDETDERLLAALRQDGRASVSELAQRLGLARATVRKRIERMVAAGDIAGFTVLTPSDVTDAPVRAMMMLAIEGRGTERVIQRLKGMAEVAALHTTNGKWDLVVELATDTLDQLDDVIFRIRRQEGVQNSETNLLLSTRKAAARRGRSIAAEGQNPQTGQHE